MYNFLIVDDHEVLRVGLVHLIKKYYPSSTIDEAADSDQAVKLVKKNDYDLLTLDLNIPGSDCNTFAKTILAIKPDLKILIYTMNNESFYAKHFFKAGVKGFLNKTKGNETELLRAIDMILRGKKYISQELIVELAEDALTGVKQNPFSQLSHRELDILNLILTGESVTNISKALNIHTSTVATFKGRIYEKLNVKNILELSTLANLYKFSDIIKPN